MFKKFLSDYGYYIFLSLFVICFVCLVSFCLFGINNLAMIFAPFVLVLSSICILFSIYEDIKDINSKKK